MQQNRKNGRQIRRSDELKTKNVGKMKNKNQIDLVKHLTSLHCAI